MNARTFLIWSVLVLFPMVVVGQTESKSTVEHLKPIEYLVGGTWKATGEIPGLGKYTAERNYRWILNNQFIEQRHVMKLGDQQMETKGILGWDSDQQELVAWGFGDDGGIVTSHAQRDAESGLRFEGVRVGEFNAGPVRATFRKINQNRFQEIAEKKNGDQWIPMFTFEFQREK